MDGRQRFELAQELAVAKGRQDVPAAMKLFHRDMLLEVPAFGTTARGPEENEKALRRFFASFPDYGIGLQGHADNGGTLVCWGTATMTMTGDRFGVIPTGRRAELPVVIQFAFKDGSIARERFFFDLSTLCAQSGVSTDVVRRTMFGDTVDAPVPADPEALPHGHRPPAFPETHHPHPPSSTSQIEATQGGEA
ncbi:ester cyclase [Streptomyces sp. NPDC101393]|uniref:ester cyclase n=1 Tax=Streptomyces sp. NPDC101393 TaxID=3366141 RepID=UPI0037FC5D61